MSMQLFHLEQIASTIDNLTSNDIARLSKILVFSGSYNAAELLDHIQADFKQLEKELGL